MKNKIWAVAAAVMATAAWLAADASAANPAFLNIDVTVAANLSVSVNGATSSTDTSSSWNTSSANAKFGGASSSTVLNNSGAQTEKWALSTSSSVDQGSGGFWSLGTSSAAVGADTFVIQAVFGSSATAAGGCPGTGSGDWNLSFAPLLTQTPATYTHSVFADTNLNTGGNGSLLLYNPDVASGGGDGRVFAGDQRALCWRLITPASTSSLDTQNVQIIITAQNP